MFCPCLSRCFLSCKEHRCVAANNYPIDRVRCRILIVKLASPTDRNRDATLPLDKRY